VSIHSDHPFLPPEAERSPLRRLRGRMPAPVSVWAATQDGKRAGWTLSSFLVVEGEPSEVIGIVDEDSPLADLLTADGPEPTVVVNILGWSHRTLADAFAEVAPAPGGPFRMNTWVDSSWGPVLADAPAWLGARVQRPIEHAGWGLLVRGLVEHLEVGTEAGTRLLGYARGRYHSLD